MPHPRKTALLLVAPFLATLAAGCSSGISRESARDQATTATCTRYNMCSMFPSAAYPSMDACEIAWRANWDKAWPASECEGKIDQAAFELCLNAISATACNVFDFFSTLGKCSAANVCDATTATDGGGG
jgi:hypothetical protein